jgi:hypothetical protein
MKAIVHILCTLDVPQLAFSDQMSLTPDFFCFTSKWNRLRHQTDKGECPLAATCCAAH